MARAGVYGRFFATGKNDKMPDMSSNPDWVTIKLGSDEDIEAADMDDRYTDAKNWVSRQLSDEESNILNRAMGIEEEIKAAEEIGNQEMKTSQRRHKRGNKASILRDDMHSTAARIRGFLEMNPFTCSGCGAPFQSKAPDVSGYLSKEKMREHLEGAKSLRAQQEVPSCPHAHT